MFPAKVKQGRTIPYGFQLSCRDDQRMEIVGGSAVQRAQALGQLDEFCIPTLVPCSGAALSQSLNTSEPWFLFCEIKKSRIYQVNFFRV